MKRVGVLYGKGEMVFEIPERNPLALVQPPIVPAGDARGIIGRALDAPIDSPTLKELTRDKRRILIITNDNTRPMPSSVSIPAILSRLYHPPEYYDITILIATGLHRPMSDQEIRERFSDALADRFRIVNHCANDTGSLVCLGRMSTGNELWVNALVPESDFVIAEGFIEPHFFAGFSGGRKSVLPGVCGSRTILYNHRPQNIASPYAACASLEKNPIHQECVEAAHMAGLGFIMNVALNADKQVIAAFAGHRQSAHEAGCAFVRERMQVDVREADIVIASNNGHPLDRNIYQAVKGMDTAAKAAKKGGVIILAAECGDKQGNNDFERLIRGCASAQELFERMSQGPSEPDKWQAQVLARILRDYRVVLLSERVDADAARGMFMLHADTPAKALDIALSLTGPDASINAIPEGPVVIPRPIGACEVVDRIRGNYV